jgi:hypothetical protein
MMDLIPHESQYRRNYSALGSSAQVSRKYSHTVQEPNHHNHHQPSCLFRVSNNQSCNLLSVLHSVRQLGRRSFDNAMLFNWSVKRKSLRQWYSRESSVQIQSDVHTITCVLPGIRLQAVEDGMEGNEQWTQTLTGRLFTLQMKFYRNIYEHRLTPQSL